MFHVSKKEGYITKSLAEAVQEARDMNNKIEKTIPKIEDTELVDIIKEINATVNKIINTYESKPEKYKNSNNFFNYYLPVTVNIINKYDEIENQSLTTEESQKFMKSTKEMVAKINEAFKKQLSYLYQSDMIDTDAEMKVFESMLKADGYNIDDDFKMK